MSTSPPMPPRQPISAPHATQVAARSDRERARTWIAPLVMQWEAEAALEPMSPLAAQRLAAAAEATEWAAGQLEEAGRLYTLALDVSAADPRAFSGLRRLARARGDSLGVWEAWRHECQRAGHPEAQALAAVGLARQMLRCGEPADRILKLMRTVEARVVSVGEPARSLFALTMADLLHLTGDLEGGVAQRANRWLSLKPAEDWSREQAARSAVALAASFEVLGDEERTAYWREVALQTAPLPSLVWPMLRERWDAGEAPRVAELLAELGHGVPSPHLRGRLLLELGLRRAWTQGDSPGALQVLREASALGDTASVAAAAFLTVARRVHRSVLSEEFADALGSRLELAASATERADLMLQMARRFASRPDGVEVALHLVQEAMEQRAHYAPAVTLLEELYVREGRFAELAALRESVLAQLDDPQERLVAHEALAELYAQQLHNGPLAEQHWRAAIEMAPSLRAIRGLASLLRSQRRWAELATHLFASGQRVEARRPRLALLEEAARVAEEHSRDRELAVFAWRELLQHDPEHPGGVLALSRLLERLGRWEELLDVLELEVGLLHDEPEAACDALCRCAEIAAAELADGARREGYLRRAMAADEEADLPRQALGGLLRAQRRWEELATFLEEELRRLQRQRRDLGRVLRELGAVYALHLGRFDDALRTFEMLASLGAAHLDEALVWIERLGEAMADEGVRVEALRARVDAAEGPVARARVAVRLAEALEWSVGDAEAAFSLYESVSGDKAAMLVALQGMDRLWPVVAPNRPRRKMIAQRWLEALERVDEPSLIDTLFGLLADRVGDVLSADERADLWMRWAGHHPHDPRVGERCALLAAADGDVVAATAFRAAGTHDEGHRQLEQWDRLEQGLAPSLHGLPHDDSFAALMVRDHGVLGTHLGVELQRRLWMDIEGGVRSVAEWAIPEEGREGALELALEAARATGDGAAWAARASDLYDVLETPLVRLRFLLEALEEPWWSVEERHAWLERAVEEPVGDHPMRFVLYDRLADEQCWRLLDSAVARHLADDGSDPAHTPELAMRRATALERLQEREEAVAVLRLAQVFDPSDTKVALYRARLEAQSGRDAEARETLQQCLDAGAAMPERLELLGRLADLHRSEGGKAKRAIAALEEAYGLTEGERSWALRLAHLHRQVGDASRAAYLFSEVLERPIRVEDLQHWSAYARLLATRLSALLEADALHWEIFDAFPERREVRELLESFHRDQGAWKALADGIAERLRGTHFRVTEELRAQLWRYVGEVYLEHARTPREAASAFAEALRGPGSGHDVVLLHARALAETPGAEGEALARLERALAAPGLGHETWREAMAWVHMVVERSGDAQRALPVRQVMYAVGLPEGAQGQDQCLTPRGDISEERLHNLLAGDLLSSELLQVLRGLLPLVEGLHKDRAPQRRALGVQRWTPGASDVFETALHDGVEWMGLLTPPRLLRMQDGVSVVPLDGQSYAVPDNLAFGTLPARARFWAGWTLGWQWTGLAPMTWLRDTEIRAIAEAVAQRELGWEGGSDGPALEAIASWRWLIQRRQATTALRERLHVLGEWPDRLTERIQRVADRAGLLLCGDAAVAVEEIAHSLGESEVEVRRPEQRMRHPRTQAVARYAISDAHLTLRRLAGLGPASAMQQNA